MVESSEDFIARITEDTLSQQRRLIGDLEKRLVVLTEKFEALKEVCVQDTRNAEREISALKDRFNQYAYDKGMEMKDSSAKIDRVDDKVTTINESLSGLRSELQPLTKAFEQSKGAAWMLRIFWVGALGLSGFCGWLLAHWKP